MSNEGAQKAAEEIIDRLDLHGDCKPPIVASIERHCPAKPQVDATLDEIAKEIRRVTKGQRRGSVVIRHAELEDIADAISAHAKSQPKEGVIGCVDFVRAIAKSDVRATTKQDLEDWVISKQVEAADLLRAAESAAPGVSMEDELAEALRHTMLCGNRFQCDQCRDAHNLLARFDKEGGK